MSRLKERLKNVRNIQIKLKNFIHLKTNRF